MSRASELRNRVGALSHDSTQRRKGHCEQARSTHTIRTGQVGGSTTTMLTTSRSATTDPAANTHPSLGVTSARATTSGC